MKQNKTLIKELRRELHYHQMMVRVDLRAVRAGVSKCKELGQKMRDLQSSKAVEQMRAADGASTCGECGQTGITGSACPNCGARRASRR